MQLSISQLFRSPIVYLLLGTIFSFFLVALVLGITPNFDDRTIGIAVLHGQDVAVRGRVQVLAILGGICFFLALFLNLRDRSEQRVHTPLQPHQAVILALVMASNVLLFLYTDKHVFLNTVYALLYLAGLGIFIARKSKDEHSANARWVIVAISYHALITAYCISGQIAQFDLQFFAFFTGLLVVAFLATQKLLENTEKLVSWVCGLWPMMLLPLAVICANEVQYSLFARYQLGVSGFGLWLAILVVLSLTGLAMFMRQRQKIASDPDAGDFGPQISRFFYARYLPLILMSTVAFSIYPSGFDFFLLRDFFHGGEAIVPMQQLLQFGAIPYVDFYPPHGLFDFFPQIFYQVINQTYYAESHLWGDGYMSGWMPRMLAVVVIYWFLGAHLSYKAAFLVLFALPTYQLIHPYYLVLLLPVMMIGDDSKSTLQWTFFWSLIVAIFLWRVDFGIAALIASLFVLIMWAWSERSYSLLAKGIAALGLVAIASAMLFVLLCVAKGYSPLSIFQQMLDYVAIISSVTAYEKILRQIDAAAVIQYLFFPMIGVVYVAYFSSHVIKRQPISKLQLVLAYLSVLSLVISVRSLNRHSHFEGTFSTYFYVMVLALFPLSMARFSRTSQVALFLVVCVSAYGFLPRTKSYFQLAYYYSRGVEVEYPGPASGQAPVLKDKEGLESNRMGPTKPGTENLVSFLDGYLKEQETFYDLTNSPLLYSLARKKLPSYIFETLFHTSEAVQKKVIADLDALYQKDDLPVVLFRQNNGWDKVDGVANEMRSYRVVEYIYKKYVPCMSIDNYEIWLSKRLIGIESCADYVGRTWPSYNSLVKEVREGIFSAKTSSQYFDLYKLPYVWANYDELDPLGKKQTEQNLTIIREDDSAKVYKLMLPESGHKEDSNYAHFRIYSDDDTTARLVYANGNGFSFDILGGPQERDYLIRISSQYAWYSQSVRSMVLESASPIELVSARIIEGD